MQRLENAYFVIFNKTSDLVPVVVVAAVAVAAVGRLYSTVLYPRVRSAEEMHPKHRGRLLGQQPGYRG